MDLLAEPPRIKIWLVLPRDLTARHQKFLIQICWGILFSTYLNKIWLSVWRHHLANLHIWKTWISLEWKEIFENSKEYFSSHEVYLYMFMFQNGLDRKDAIFVIAPHYKQTRRNLILCLTYFFLYMYYIPFYYLVIH